ncbi:MAG: 50S ribosomal protein L15 [Candidatus Omnitrophota bacterium]
MKLNELRAPKGATKRKKRVGRGVGSGHGKTSTRGSKGLLARAGGSSRLGFEGGQMPLIRRIPKRGFTSKFKVVSQVVNVDSLNNFKEDQIVDKDLLYEVNLISDVRKPVKILGDGELKKAVKVRADSFSAQARKKIEAAGGNAEVVKTKKAEAKAE